MRVIAGSARRLLLKTVEGKDTRPTTDRIKETLFNILSFDIEGCRFLDLYAGSGAIGIEALSRGASRAVFVEMNKKAAVCIRDNLEHTHLSDRALLLHKDVSGAILWMEGREQAFDYIYMDPPYGKSYEREVLELLSRSDLCSEETTIIIESDLETSFDYIDQLPFLITREKRYKTNKHTFLKIRA